MQVRGGQWSDDEIYAWFVTAVSEEGSAAEIEPNVVRVVIEPDDDTPGGSVEQVDIVITREQLRTLAWASEDVFDDRDLDGIPLASDPVLTGLQTLTMNVEADLATLRPQERCLVFFQGRLRKSVRRELPPIRGPRTWGHSKAKPGGHFSWSAED
jgi:hypothetical protein